MLLVLEDDGCLHVYSRVEEVVLSVEALDAEAVLLAVFDEAGTRYRIHWLAPNRASRCLGSRSVENGRYELRAAERDLEGLRRLVRETPVILPASQEGAVRALEGQVPGSSAPKSGPTRE